MKAPASASESSSDVGVGEPQPGVAARRMTHDVHSRRTSSWGNRVSTSASTSDLPMFTMSVRMQNPPEPKLKHSASNCAPAPKLAPASKPPDASGEPARMAWQATNPALPPQQLLAKLSARPWKSKEEKERQNVSVLQAEEKVIEQVETIAHQPELVGAIADATVEQVADAATDKPLDEQLDRIVDKTPDETTDDAPADEPEDKSGNDASPEVKLRSRPPPSQKAESELLKVFARRSLVPRSPPFRGHQDVAMETSTPADPVPADKVDPILT